MSDRGELIARLRGVPLYEGHGEESSLPEPPRGSDEWKRWNAVHRMPPGPDRARLRSRSFPGMMAAAAEQWSRHAAEQIRRVA